MKKELKPKTLVQVLRDRGGRILLSKYFLPCHDFWRDEDPYRMTSVANDNKALPGAIVERLYFSTTSGLRIPAIIVQPMTERKRPVVLCVAQEGKQRFVQERAEAIAELLAADIAVALVDVRGTGETAPADNGRDRTGYASDLSASALMLGQFLIMERFRDAQQLLLELNGRNKFSNFACWGDAFAPVNSAAQTLPVPHGVDGRPQVAEALGGFVALMQLDVRVAHYVHHAQIHFATALDAQNIYLPHDAVFPYIEIEDVDEFVRYSFPICFENPVNAENRYLSDEQARKYLSVAILKAASTKSLLEIRTGRKPAESAAAWLKEQLLKK